MGLIKAAVEAGRGVTADQWREYIYCDSLSADVLVSKGQKRTSRGSSNRGRENIITNGSLISINEGQFMMIVEQGKVVEFSDDTGEFVYDSSTEPTLFYGGFGEGLLESFKTFGKRFTFGGDTAKDQRVYYFNKKEILGNKYGTPAPVPFRVVDQRIGLDMDIAIRCHGEYSYKIVDPLVFFANVCGNVEDTYPRENIDSQLKSELMTALQPAFAKISALGIRYSALPGHSMEIAQALNEVLSDQWVKSRGLAVASVGISMLKASEEDEEMIKQLQRAAVFTNPTMAAARMVDAQAEAMVGAANNQNAGPVMAFAGMNMAQQTGGVNAANLFAMGQQQQQAPAQPQAQTPPAEPGQWTCRCGNVNKSGNFCIVCGKPKSDSEGWTCTCGAFNKGRFCPECGKPKPEGAKVYKCDKCGWEPEDKEHPPKFCPECGDPFNDDDVQ